MKQWQRQVYLQYKLLCILYMKQASYISAFFKVFFKEKMSVTVSSVCRIIRFELCEAIIMTDVLHG